jgi:hypothetical protein
MLSLFLFLQVSPSCHPAGQDDAEIPRNPAVAVDAGIGSTRPVSAHDCEPANDHHPNHSTLGVLRPVARGMGHLSWLSALLAAVAALSTAVYPSAIHCRKIGVRQRHAERNPRRTGRLLLIDLCIARS